MEAHPQAALGESSEEEPDEQKKEGMDPGIAQKEEYNDDPEEKEGGPKGDPTGAAADAEPIGMGTEEGQQGDTGEFEVC